MKKIINNKKFLLISIFLCFSLFLCTFITKESDYFWHIKAGEYMFNHGILTEDVFSYITYGKHWMSHEWLFELIIYSLKIIVGNYNMIIYIFISLFTIYLFSYFYNKEKMLNNLLFTVIWLVFSCIFMAYIQCRPHFISFIMLSITMYLLYSLIKNENSKKIYILPLLTIIWSNAHGGSSNLGYLLCFFLCLIGIFEFRFNKIEAKKLSKMQLKKLLIIGLICIFCTTINPHGFRMTIYPYINIMDNTMINSIAEWSPTNINELAHLPFFILSVFILFIFLFSKKRINFIDFSLFGLGLLLGLKTIRFWPYLYIISSYFIFDYINKFTFNNMKFIILFLDVMIIMMFTISFKNISFEVNKKSCFLDNKMISLIKKSRPQRLFNSYDTGGELVYYDIPVFIDGRADLYSSYGVLNNYLNIVNLDYDYEELIDKYNFDYYLVNSGSKLEKYIKSLGAIEIYSYKDYVFYKIK